MRLSDMMTVVVAALALLLVKLPLGRSSCDGEGTVLICRSIPAYFRAGHLTLVMYVRDVGDINSSAFHSDSLASVTRLRMDDAGVTSVASGAFGTLRSLASVSLRGNALTRASWTWFGRPAALRDLSLAGNRLEAVHASTFSGLTSLERLSLGRNRIRTLGPDSFGAQANLAELDLSENRLTRLSPQVLGALGATRVTLGRNPWDCACAAEDSVSFLKDLQSRSLLLRPTEVTCDSPPSLRGRPAWDVSPCAPAPSPGSTSPPQTDQWKPTDAPATGPAASSAAARPTSDTTPVLTTLPEHTATRVTSPPSDTRTSGPSHAGLTETCVTSVPPSDTSTVCALTVVIVVLCVLLCAACFLAVKRRRKRTHAKAVAPGRPHEERSQSEASRGPSALGASRGTIVRDPETVWTRPFSEVRAKSANAVLFISPFCVSGNQVTVENETEDQSEVTEKQADGKKEVENETGEIQAINITDKNQKESDDGRKMDENPHCASVGVDTVPYLSIGANQNKPNPDRLDEQPTDGVGQRSHVGKVLGRISTWPPTAVQWQARCQMTEEDEEERETGKSPSEVNQVERPSASDRDKTGDLVNQEPPKMNEALMESTHSRPSNLNYQGASLSQAQASADAKQEDQSAVRRTTRGTPGQGPGRPAHGDASESGGGKAEERNGRRPSATSRQRGSAKRSAGSKAAPSGGASPDDATLLRGNEYAFMDLLHEVVQHHGRWTRQRWRQSHVNKPRR